MESREVLKEMSELMAKLDEMAKDPFLKDYNLRNWITGFRMGIAHMFTFGVQGNVPAFHKPAEDIRRTINNMKQLAKLAEEKGKINEG